VFSCWHILQFLLPCGCRVAPFQALPLGFWLTVIDPGFISRVKLWPEGLTSCIVSTWNGSDSCYHCLFVSFTFTNPHLLTPQRPASTLPKEFLLPVLRY
jgi:hypothetical protein